MILGLIREGKTPPDKRVALSPEQCKQIHHTYPEVQIVVQKSDIRCFTDKAYTDVGVQLLDSLESCDIIVGIKEVPIGALLESKRYMFFSHTAKKQPYNRNLLKAILEKNNTLIDYEYLTNEKGRRVIGFGRYAGIVGAYNGLLTYGKITGLFELKPAHMCADREEIENELEKVHLTNQKMVLTGSGRVSGGVKEILKALKIKEITVEEFFSAQHFEHPVYVNPMVTSLYQRKDGSSDFKAQDFYNAPQYFQSQLSAFYSRADILFTGHSWSNGAPILLSKEDLKQHSNTTKKVVADISCDIDGPIACTVRPSKISDPFYFYDVVTQSEVSSSSEQTVAVMAVDNLPCELPKDASIDFGTEFIKHILPELIKSESPMIQRATIAKEGQLTSVFSYLEDFVKEL